MPYIVIDGTSIYDRLREPKFHSVTFSSEEGEWQALNKSEYAGLIDFNSFQLNDEVAEIFGAERAFTIFLRPDNYIGFISSKLSFVELENYLRTVTQHHKL